MTVLQLRFAYCAGISTLGLAFSVYVNDFWPLAAMLGASFLVLLTGAMKDIGNDDFNGPVRPA